MTVTYGFYNSVGGDRKYDAIQMSRLFDGILQDGIFASIGNTFVVHANAPAAMNVVVGSGRAWFNHTWTLNDNDILVTIEPSELTLNRIDTIVIEVNTSDLVRANSIKAIKGTPGSSPVAPTLANTSTLKQYPLADVYVGTLVTTITSGNITNRIGTTPTPFVTGILETVDISVLLTQYANDMNDMLAADQLIFDDWLAEVQAQLSSTDAATLQAEVDVLENYISYSNNYSITPSLSGSNLVLSIFNTDGSNPSTTKPLRFRLGNTKYTLTAATAFTKNAGTNWMNLGSAELFGKNTDLFVYAIGETGASAGLKFGYSRIPFASSMADFVNTTTNEKYIAGNWTNFNASDKVTVIGRFTASLSGGAGYTWSLSAADVINYPIYETKWQYWTPIGTNFTIGNSAFDCRYKLVGSTMYNSFYVALGSTSSVGTDPYFSLPFTISVMGGSDVLLVDFGSAGYVGVIDTDNAHIFPRAVTTNATYAGYATTTAVVPFTWTTNDSIRMKFWSLL